MTTATASVAAPRCGSCEYDTTGLMTLTCPECGADLRVAGINHGGPTHTLGAFIASALALVLAWVLCGTILVSAVSTLVPYRQHIQRTTRLGAPGSGGYRAVDVVATGSGWMDERPTMRVEVQLVPLAPGDASPAMAFGAASVAPKPPAPLAVSQGISAEDVLAWFASAGISSNDPRVRDEAQTVALTATRGLRTRGRFGSSSGWANSGFSSSNMSSGRGGPFGSVTSTLRGSTLRTSLHTPLFAVLWVALLVACVVFQWRCMRPRVRSPAASP